MFRRIYRRLVTRTIPNLANFAVWVALRLLVNAAALPLAVAACVVLRRFRHKKRPVVLFGISPVISNKYWSEALRKRGYATASFAYGSCQILDQSYFDYTSQTLFPKLSRLSFFPLLEPYLCFFWALKNFDVFVLDFDLGFFRWTPFRFFELPLLRLAGRKIIAIPYGGDATDVRRCRDERSKAAIVKDYPELLALAEGVERRVRHYSRWASLIVCGGFMLDFLPRADFLTASFCAIDTDEWRNDREPTESSDGPVKILHAPNHRNIKGTQFLIDACEELRREGLPVELIIKEGVHNSEIREAMRDADIVAAAFITGFYELFPIEGMSMGKPVLNYWRPDLKRIYSERSFASECPIVDTPPEKIKENVRALAEDPALRLKLGEAGRRYVEKHHSYDAIGRTLDQLVRKVWDATEVAARREEPEGPARLDASNHQGVGSQSASTKAQFQQF
jgi:glycosyltransferase involved in cell wall biosynthesis